MIRALSLVTVFAASLALPAMAEEAKTIVPGTAPTSTMSDQVPVPEMKRDAQATDNKSGPGAAQQDASISLTELFLRPEWHCAATTVDAKDDRISNGAPFAGHRPKRHPPKQRRCRLSLASLSHLRQPQCLWGPNPLTAAAHAHDKTAGGVRNSPYRPWVTMPRG